MSIERELQQEVYLLCFFSFRAAIKYVYSVEYQTRLANQFHEITLLYQYVTILHLHRRNVFMSIPHVADIVSMLMNQYRMQMAMIYLYFSIRG